MADISLSSTANVRALLGTIVKPVECAEAVTVGEAVYLDSQGKAALADADAAASARVRGVVVAIGAYGKTTSVAGDMVDVCFYGPIAGWTGLTPGDPLYASTTAGAIEDAAPAGASGDYKWIVGFQFAADTIFVQPFTDDTAAQ